MFAGRLINILRVKKVQRLAVIKIMVGLSRFMIGLSNLDWAHLRPSERNSTSSACCVMDSAYDRLDDESWKTIQVDGDCIGLGAMAIPEEDAACLSARKMLTEATPSRNAFHEMFPGLDWCLRTR